MRAHWALVIAMGARVACWRCGRRIRPGDDWHLGHRRDRVAGGSDADAAPECAACNLRHGGATGGRRFAERQQLRAQGITPPPSPATERGRAKRARRNARRAPSRRW
jgi:hypothetical protein